MAMIPSLFLVTMGWFFFTAGQLFTADLLLLKIAFLAAARVLP